jgi:hypothetical protein
MTQRIVEKVDDYDKRSRAVILSREAGEGSHNRLTR